MGTSPETFEQVRDILRKLDEGIDDARRRRTQTPDRTSADHLAGNSAGIPGSPGISTPGSNGPPPGNPGTPGTPGPAGTPAGSPGTPNPAWRGRAKPLRPAESRSSDGSVPG